MSSRLNPASAMASRLASRVSRIADFNDGRPTSDWPTPVMATSFSNSRSNIAGPLKQWDPDVFELCESDRYRHANGHFVRVATDDVGKKAQIGLFGQFDDGNHVGFDELRRPCLAVDGKGHNPASARDRAWRHIETIAARADRVRRVEETATAGAVVNLKDPAGSALPKRRSIGGKRGEFSGHRPRVPAPAAFRPAKNEVVHIRHKCLTLAPRLAGHLIVAQR